MPFQHTVIWIFLITWAWGLPSADTINSTEEILNQLGYDSEAVIPEEDIIYLNSLLNEDHTVKNAITILSSISILSAEDQEILNQIRTLKDLYKNNQISTSLKRLIMNINIINKPTINAFIREKITITNGIRHDLRSSVSFRDYQFHLLFEKDPGEQNILDHAVFSVQGNTNSVQWIVGDHQLEGGYGLITWKATSAYKGFETINVLTRKGKGLKPYRSSNEYWSTKGLGVQWNSSFGTMMVSIGNTLQDGKVEDGKINIDETGLHVTKNDLAYKNNLKEQSATFLWTNDYLGNHFGIIMNNQHVVEGNGSTVSKAAASVFTTGKWQNWQWFGESAIHNNQHISYLSGVIFRLDRIKYLVTIRSYPHHFRAYRSQPFSEWSSFNDGERGVFQNIQVKVKKHTFALYSDIAQKVEEGNNTPYRLINHENGLRWQWYNSTHRFKIQFKQNSQTINEVNFEKNIFSTEKRRTTSKWQYQYNINKQLNIRWQINTASFNKNESNGYGLETRILFKGNNVVSTASWIVAKVNDYSGRVYFWGLNLPGEMNSVAISHNGQQLGARIQLLKRDNYRIFARYRIKWPSLKFEGTTVKTGALAIQINL